MKHSKMCILQELEESLQSDAQFYMDFLYRYDPKKKQVFAFYEGDEDSSFYHHFLKEAIDDDCELEEIVAGCKSNVIKLQREFDWRSYDNNQIIFFVDRDLSYWLTESTRYGKNVFVTDGYSVENYIVSPQGFRSWLTHFEGFARASKKELDGMISQYKVNIADFNQKMMPIMARAVVAKRHDRSISLGEFKISGGKSVIFNTCDGCLGFTVNMGENVSKKWKLTSEHRAEVDRQIDCFKRSINHYSVRGKWALCFMAEMGEYMRLNADMFAPSLKAAGKISPTCSVHASQCFSVLAPYCVEVIPKRLEHFLNATYHVYMRRFKCKNKFNSKNKKFWLFSKFSMWLH